MNWLYDIAALLLPWVKLPQYPPVAVCPKLHLIGFYTSGFE